MADSPGVPGKYRLPASGIPAGNRCITPCPIVSQILLSSRYARCVEASNQQTGRTFQSNLEALRGIAALLVVLHHLALNPGSILASMPLLGQGWLFVDLFFVLSGYVIASVHLESRPTIFAALSFLARRFFRLYPLHLATLAFALALDMKSGTAFLPGYWIMVSMNIALVHAWGFVPGSVLNGPSWSISTEWGTYLVFTAICLLAPSQKGRLQLLGGLGFLCFLSLVAWRNASLNGDLLLRLPRCLMSFAIGAGVWAWCQGRPALQPLVAVCFQVLLATSMIALLAFSASDAHLTLLMPIISAALIATMARDPGSRVCQLLDKPVPQWLGRCSYSLYLVHMPLFRCLLIVTPGGWPREPLLVNLWMAVTLCFLLLTAGLTHALIEKPFRTMGRRISNSLQHARGRAPLARFA